TAILREAAPDVVVTFGPEGITEHEDHIATSQATTEAFHAARDALGVGGPADSEAQPLRRLFYTGGTQAQPDRRNPRTRSPGTGVGPDAPFMPRGVPEHTITVRVNTSSVGEGKYAALSEHATQEEEIHAFTDFDRDLMLSVERFIQAWPPVTDPAGPTSGSIF